MVNPHDAMLRIVATRTLLPAVLLIVAASAVLSGLFGNRMGGKGNVLDVYAALSWSCVPLLIGQVAFLIVELPIVVLYRSGVVSPLHVELMVMIALAISLVPAAIIFVNSLAAVHRFSAGEASKTIALPLLTISLVFEVLNSCAKVVLFVGS
jgi:hypothetical protein